MATIKFPINGFLLAIIFCFASINVKAQLVVTPGGTPASIVSSLIGGGMTVSNVQMNCPTNAYGTFANGNTTNLGLTNGILLTTGNAAMAIGPNNSVSAGFCNNTSSSDPQLVAIEPQATYDLCVLEFDIVPECSQLTVRFVFGSEEYPEFVNASFNDAFGFFISGPGPAPSCSPNFYNNTNVATLPNNTTPVSIDNVNAGNNAAYYVDNTGGTTIQYDGFTTVLTRTINLCPCQTYHWKFAIADAGDCIYDSGVFLDFLSCSNALTINPSSTPVTSCSSCDGTASVALVGGTGPFTYTWSPAPPVGQGTPNASQLCAGTYTVTVVDALSCSPPSTVAITVGANVATLTITPTQTNVACFGQCNGTASVTVAGGTPGYTYNWLPSGGSGPSATGLCPGVYTCAVTDQTGCSATVTITITEPPQLSASTSSTPAACGNNNGSASVVASGGTAGYTYLWQPTAGIQATENNLNAGTYTCIITDANGCSISPTVTVASTGGLSSTIAGTDAACFGGSTGSVTMTPVGGNPGYTFVWTPNVSSTGTASNLTAGTYQCTVTDASGCSSTASYTVSEPAQLTVSSAGFNVTCNGACDGQVVTIPGGGTPNYTFLWNTGCTTAACSNICAGNYTVTVTDANGCTAQDTANVTQPVAVTSTATFTPATCGQSDGSATATGSGGTGTFTYQWIGGPASVTYPNIPAGTYSCVIADGNNCTDTAIVTVTNLNGVTLASCGITDVSCFGACDGSINVCAGAGTAPFAYTWSPSISATPNATNVCAGVYVATVTDANGCSASVTTTVTEPPQLTATATATPSAVCVGSPVTLNCNVSGGTPSYSYNWNPGNLSGNTQTLTPAASTTYSVDVTDANGCSTTATVAVVVSDMPVVLFSGDSLTGCAPLCVNFSDQSTVTAPSAITQWNWNFGDNTTSSLQNPNHCYTTPGLYTVTLTVTTNGGCTQTFVLNNYIEVYGMPHASFVASPQPTTILTPTINFTDQSTNAGTWLWNFGDVLNSSSSMQNPSFTYTDPICYQVSLEVTSPDGCVDDTSSEICIQPDVGIYVPNTFTPNDDGVNEVFIPVTVGINPDKYEFWVFDRWGNMIFYTDDLNEGWNGCVLGSSRLCQIDTYVWKVKCVDVLDKKHNLIGHVNLIR